MRNIMAKDSNNSLSRSFKLLNATQFTVALNDNIFKLLIIFSLISLQGEDSAGRVTAVAGMVFVLPFLLFTPIAGVLADHIEKRSIVIGIKVFEILVMLSGVAAFYLNISLFQYTVLFMMSMQSAFFGPAKYGIIPELTSEHTLSKANSYIVSYTFFAIILGTFFGPFLADMTGSVYYKAAFFCVGVAVAGTITAVMIKKSNTEPAKKATPLHRIDRIFTILFTYRHERQLLFAIFASMYFYFVGAFLQLNLIPYGMEVLGLTQEKSGYLFLVAAIGIGIGSLIAGKLTRDVVEFGFVTPGAIGLGLAILALPASASLVSIVAVVFVAGIFSGMFVVPIQTFIQYKSPSEHRGKILAASGFLSWIGILMASLCLYLFRETMGMSAANTFVPLGVLTVLLTGIMLWVFPDLILQTKQVIVRSYRGD